jgi:hypothetical protein
VLLAPCLVLASFAEPVSLPGGNILERLEDYQKWRAGALREYEVNRKYLLDGPRFGQKASMDVRVNYSFPGRKDARVMRAAGSSFLRARVLDRVIDAEIQAASDELRAETGITSRNYEMRVTGASRLDGRPCYIIEITPRRAKGYLLRGRIWVDAEDAAIVRVEGEPVSDGSFWVRNVRIVETFRKVGPFWLLDSMNTDADVRLYGPARLRIDCDVYQINRSYQASAAGSGQ